MQLVQSGVLTLDWATLLRGSRCFAVRGDQTAAASNFPHIQLYNPAASARIIILRGIAFSTSTAGVVSIRRYDTALTTAGDSGQSLRFGGSAGVGILRRQDSTSVLGTGLFQLRAAANTHQFLGFEWLAEIPVTTGIVVVHETAATRLDVSFLWTEIPA